MVHGIELTGGDLAAEVVVKLLDEVSDGDADVAVVLRGADDEHPGEGLALNLDLGDWW